MISLESIEIEEFRGIRRLRLDLNGKNFAICGRNGTGKSGIVDAIEFGLTGSISRLSGEGTANMSVKEHAPHVDSRSDPARAKVVLTVRIPSLGRTATISRSPHDSRRPIVTPADKEVLEALGEMESHPEVVLTRREIIRYILATDGKRSTEVQAVLRLDGLAATRQTLQAIANGRARELKLAHTATAAATDALKSALGVQSLNVEAVLKAVNDRRKILDLPELTDITSTTVLREGLSGAARANSRIVKSVAVADILNVSRLSRDLGDRESDAYKNSVELCTSLSNERTLLDGLVREGFWATGLRLIDGALCPFCEQEWNADSLKAQIESRLASLKYIKEQRENAEAGLSPVVTMLREFADSLEQVARHARMLGPQAVPELTSLRKKALTAADILERLVPIETTLEVLSDLPRIKASALSELEAIDLRIKALPEATEQDEAKAYLILGHERMSAYRKARRTQVRLQQEATIASTAAKVYGQAVDAELEQLYETVEKEFAEMYSELNSPDEAGFVAQLTPSTGRLGFGVNFYGRGIFPPGAYHSEGHQDAMGLCLYLALMSHVLKGGFQIAVLDDVLMSVDAGHRRAVCSLLKRRFPNTQFVLTTHDRVWLNHMRTEGLVSGKGFTEFRSWDVAVGPAVFHESDVWNEIGKELENNRVQIAAEILRNHLEYIAGELCDRLGARVQYRADGRVDLGMLLPPAHERLSELYSKGKTAANSWNHRDDVSRLKARSENLASAYAATRSDQWQMNASIHYNAWASLEKTDFVPVVDAFKAFLAHFACEACGAYLGVVRDGLTPKAVVCDCGKATFGLTVK